MNSDQLAEALREAILAAERINAGVYTRFSAEVVENWMDTLSAYDAAAKPQQQAADVKPPSVLWLESEYAKQQATSPFVSGASSDGAGALLVPKVGNAWLCEAFGETDRPCAIIARNRAEVRQFLIDEWFGGEDDELDEALDRFDEHDFSDGSLKWKFEIGGVHIGEIFFDNHSRFVLSNAPTPVTRTAATQDAALRDPETKRAAATASATVPQFKFDALVADYKKLEADLFEARQVSRLHRMAERGYYWAWQGDGEDRPESLSCPVLVPAAQVRAWIAASATAVEPVAFRWALKGTFGLPLEWSHWNDMAHYETARKCHGPGANLVFEYAFAPAVPAPQGAAPPGFVADVLDTAQEAYNDLVDRRMFDETFRKELILMLHRAMVAIQRLSASPAAPTQPTDEGKS